MMCCVLCLQSGSGMFDSCSVSQLAAGLSFSLALAGGKVPPPHTGDSMGLKCRLPWQVWSWGTGASGQLGQPKPPRDPNRPAFMQQRFSVQVPQVIEDLR